MILHAKETNLSILKVGNIYNQSFSVHANASLTKN